jgi:hydroxyacylglutathione hydrolase
MTKVTKLFYEEGCNSYVFGDEGKPCVLVDPSYRAGKSLSAYVHKHHPRCAGILITHGHFDHIGGLIDLDFLSGTPVFMGEDDIPLLSDPRLNGSDSFELNEPVIVKGFVPYPVDDEDEIKLGAYLFKAFATPFHTKGSFCFYVPEEKILFSGDTLFHLGIGRTDLPGGSQRTIGSSLMRLMSLPGETKVYPGHGENTTLQNEIAFNEAFHGLKSR